MNIVLINPPFIFSEKSVFITSHCVGLRSISSFLKRNPGHTITFLDAFMRGRHQARRYADGYLIGLSTEEIIAGIPPDAELIGVSVPFSQLAPVVHDIIARIKDRFPRVTVVMGGVYPSTQPGLALTSRADFIVLGDGEQALAAIAAGEKPENIPGVYSPCRAIREKYFSAVSFEDLDNLPFPDCSIPGMETYFRIPNRPNIPIPSTVLVTSRGCPFDCEFCSIHPFAGYRYRFRSAGNVLEEIVFLSEKFKIRFLDIEDDNFTLNRERAVEILEGIIRLNERGAGIAWCTPNGLRIETLDKELIRLIKLSNCAEVVVGLEHADPGILRSMNKQLDLERAEAVIRGLMENRIPKITLFLVVGYPGETRTRFEQSRSFLKNLFRMGPAISVCVNIVQPYPGTKLLERCRSEGYIVDKDFDNFLVRRDLMDTERTVSIITPDFSAWEVFYRRNLLIADSGNRRKWKAVLKKIIPAQFISVARTAIDFSEYQVRKRLKRKARSAKTSF
ncbi:MAG: radical SAM protein [Candidatus Omnitrophota bacterium]|jgi:radical SAM superfamily enzyme YgiQ (UPF0313 family)